MSNRGFTSASEGIVRIHHTVIYQELLDIAHDLDLPLQVVFDKFCHVLFDDYNVDAMLIKTVADCEHKKKIDSKEIPF